MKEATLCFLTREPFWKKASEKNYEKKNEKSVKEILLGMKKIGFGKDKFNGFGGKVENNETVEEAAIRELFEESKIKTKLENIEKMAKLNFVFPSKPEWNQKVHVFLVKNWEGEPEETDEMKPFWVNMNEIPFERMWKDDKHWLPLVLENKKIKANFIFKEDNENIKEFNIKECKVNL